MTDAEFKSLENQIEHKVRGLIDDHPLTCRLSETARRNMAYSAGGAALCALTQEELNSCGGK